VLDASSFHLLELDLETARLLRDTLSAAVAGLGVMGMSRYLADRRALRKLLGEMEKRMERLAVEIRHTQHHAKVKPFYPDKL
jgi:hypothetical protein